jgi:hypothetical protein
MERRRTRMITFGEIYKFVGREKYVYIQYEVLILERG